MSLTVGQTTDGYDYTVTFGGQSRRAKRDGRVPNTTAVLGDFSNGFENVVTYNGQVHRQKRKGRIPSTTAIVKGVSTGLVNDSYEIPSIGTTVEVSIDTYLSDNEIEEEAEE